MARSSILRASVSGVQPMPRNYAHGPSSFRQRVMGSIAVLAMAIGLPASLHAQASASSRTEKTQTSLRPRDLSGLWFGGVGGGLRVQGKVAPMTPEGQARFDANTVEI